MNKQPTKSLYRIGAGVIIGILIVTAGVFAYIRHRQSLSDRTTSSKHLPNVDYNPATSEDNSSNETRKSLPPGKDTIDGNSSSTTGTDAKPSVTITRAGVSDNNLVVAALVQGASDGTCTMTASQTGQTPVTASEAIQLQNSSQTCPTFIIPLSRFSNRGAWDVSVSVTTASGTAASAWQANPVQLSQ